MDTKTEDKIIQLQICIEKGHRYNLDIEAINGQEILLECRVCEYTKSVELTPDQLKRIDAIFDEEDKLLDEILKNK